jgi:hypothetical protein
MSLRARCANAKNVYDVMGVGESVGRGNHLCPLFYGVGLNFDGFSARAANEVVMMAAGATGTIEALAIWRCENIGSIVIDERSEGPIDRCQPQGVARGPESRM